MKKTLIFFLLAGCLMLGCSWWLLATPAGINVLLAASTRLLQVEVHADSIQGGLLGGVTLTGLQYADQTQSLHVHHLNLALNWQKILQGTLAMDRLVVHGVRYAHRPAPKPAPAATTNNPFSLPLPVELGLLQLEDLTYPHEAEAAPTVVHALTITDLRLSQEEIKFQQLDLHADQGSGTFHARLPLQAQRIVDGRIDFAINLPGYQPIAGSSTIQGELSGLEFTAAFKEPFPLTCSGTFQPKGPPQKLWQLSLESDRVLPHALNHGWTAIELMDVRLAANGNFDHAAVTVQTLLKQEGFPQGVQANASFTVRKDGMEVERLHMEHNQAKANARGSIRWNNGFAWQAAVEGEGMDPALFFPGWEGVLQLQGSSQGHISDRESTATVVLDRLDGTLRGYPVQASGTLSKQGEKYTVDAMEVESGESRLRLHGTCDSSCAVEVALDAPDMRALWPEAQGRLRLSGNLTGPRERLQLNTTFNGEALAYASWSTRALSGAAEAVLAQGGKLAANIRIDHQQLGTIPVARTMVALQGTTEQVEAQLQVEDHDWRLKSTMTVERQAAAVQALVTQFTLHGPDRPQWQLHAPFGATYQAGNVHTDEACMVEPQAGRVCAQMRYTSDGRWQMQGRFSEVTSAVLQPFLADVPPMKGSLQGNVTLEGAEGGLSRGTAVLEARKVYFSEKERPDLAQLGVITGRLTAALEQAILTGSLDLQNRKGSMMKGKWRLANIHLPAMEPEQIQVTGKGRFLLHDAAQLNPLFGESVKMTGELEGDFSVNGPMIAPRLVGKASLDKGTAAFPGLGIVIDPLTLEVNGTPEKVGLTLQGRSGEGVLSVNGSFVPAAGTDQEVQLSIQGNDFLTYNANGYRIVTSPRLNAVLSREKGSVSGELLVPAATIAQHAGNGKISPSADVLIIDSEQQTGKQDWPLFADIDLVAGEDVYINAYGLQGQIRGRLRVIDRPQSLPVGTGTVRIVNGSFGIYGKRLAIDVGRLVFAGGPLNNPGIEVRSERRQDGQVTGVELSGLLRDPEIRFYSSPYKEQYEILTSLLEAPSDRQNGNSGNVFGELAQRAGLTGIAKAIDTPGRLLGIDDIKMETGDKLDSLSLIIGSWLTPRFYVSYGRNLLDETGTFTTRYTLGKGFYLKTETGTTRSSGDLKYEFER